MGRNNTVADQRPNGHNTRQSLQDFVIPDADALTAFQGLHPKSQVLSSWKEIAHYINRGVRTVQRWERDYGLPVHRPKAHIKGSVFALKNELDSWLARVPSRDADSPLLMMDRLRRLEAECDRIREALARIGQS